MGPGKAPPLSGFETYNQIVGLLARKAYKGVHMHCPACTSTSFGAEGKTSNIEEPESKKGTRPWRYTMTWDVREEFAGKTRHCRKRPIICTNASGGPQHPRHEMDEGTPMFLQRRATGILVVIETPNRWR